MGGSGNRGRAREQCSVVNFSPDTELILQIVTKYSKTNEEINFRHENLKQTPKYFCFFFHCRSNDFIGEETPQVKMYRYRVLLLLSLAVLIDAQGFDSENFINQQQGNNMGSTLLFAAGSIKLSRGCLGVPALVTCLLPSGYTIAIAA